VSALFPNLNPVSALAVVEQCWHGDYSLRWWFRLEDEEGTIVHAGEKRHTKQEAINDRDDMLRSALTWRKRVDDGYRDADDSDARVNRVMLRAPYKTRAPL
jgi:hypothetical protein